MENFDMASIMGFFTSEAVINFVKALAILIIGYIIAKIIAKVFVKVMSKMTFLDRFFEIAEVGFAPQKVVSIIGKVIFYIILLMVVIAALEIMGLESLKSTLEGLQAKYIPALLASVSALVLAWVVATIAKLLISKGFKSAHIDEKLNKELSDGKNSKEMAIGETLANAAYWFIFLFFLPRIVEPLGFGSMMTPVTDLTNTIIGYIPNIFAAAITFVIAYVIAKIIKKVVINLLSAVGADKVGDKIGIKRLSALAGSIVFIIILLPFVVQALATLEIDAISVPATNILNTITAAIPNILSAGIILGVSFLIGKIVCGIITDLLKNVGFDSVPKKMGLKLESKAKLSKMTGTLVFAFIMLFAAIEASNVLGFAILSNIVTQFVEFGGQILAGAVVIGVGAYIANIVGDVVKATSKSKAMPKLAKGAVLTLAIAMGLKQMGIADDIINLAFGLMLGSVAVAGALAFGLGSREVAAKHLDSWLNSMKK